MGKSAKTAFPPPIRVQRGITRKVPLNRTFLPVAPGFLAALRPVPATIFRLTGDNLLESLVDSGQLAPPAIRNAIQDGDLRETLYVRADDKDALLRYQEDVLDEVLASDRIPLGGKCRALHNLAFTLARELFDKPLSVTLFRQVENTRKIADFIGAEMRSVIPLLLRMARTEYADATHAVNVGLYGLALAEEVHPGMAAEERRQLAAGLFLHDIGKCRVSPRILQKPGPLDEVEWREMKKHPRYGTTLLEREALLADTALQIVLRHHERMDATGYPDRLSGSEIHPHARLCAIVDAYDALTTQRVFRPSNRPFDALRTMKEEMNAQFDPGMFRAFVLLMKR